jgi:outer membrane protein
MPKYSMRLTCLSLAMAASLPAVAQTAYAPRSNSSIGLGALWNPSPYRAYDNKPLPAPMLRYEGESFYVRGASLGYRFSRTQTDELSIVAAPFWQRFLHGDSHDPRLRQLSDRDISGLAGVAWRHQADWGVLQASAQKEFTGHGGGSLLDANYSYTFGQGALRVTPTLGAAYATAALNDYYYGVGLEQAARSGLPRYRPGGGTSPYLGIAAGYQLSRSWVLSGGLRYTVLPKTIKDSPMVAAGHTQSYFFALSRLF